MTKKLFNEIIVSARTSSKVSAGTQEWVAPDEQTIIDVAKVIVALYDRLYQAEELLFNIIAPGGMVVGLYPTVPDFLNSPLMVNGVAISG